MFAEGQSLGLTLFILIILQASLGATAHLFKIPHRLQTKDGRGPANYLHPIVGLGVMGVGWATLYAAMVQQWPSRKRPVLNVGWMVGWGLVVAVRSDLPYSNTRDWAEVAMGRALTRDRWCHCYT